MGKVAWLYHTTSLRDGALVGKKGSLLVSQAFCLLNNAFVSPPFKFFVANYETIAGVIAKGGVFTV